MKKLLLYGLVVILFNSCSKKHSSVEGITATGFVFLHNEFGQYLPNNSGVTISTVKGPYANSDSAGQFTLINCPNSVTTVIYSKPGYGTHSYPASQNALLLPSINLYQLPTTIITGLQAANNFNPIYIKATIQPASTAAEPRSAAIFLGKDSTVSPTNNIGSYYAGKITGGTISETITLDVSSATNTNNLKTVYLVAYGVAYDSLYTQQNMYLGVQNYTYPAIGNIPSNVVKVTLTP